MNTIKLIGVSLLIGITTGAAGGELPFRTDINPALQYYQAFLMAPDMPQADRDYLSTNDWRGQRLPDRFGSLISQYDNQFKLLRQAARATVPCDWGFDMTPGPATLLPHLARCKAAALTARLRARWDLQQGRQVEACDDLLAAFALARNCSRDGTLISVLVQIAMESIVCFVPTENFYQFSSETLARLATGFEAAPARGTLAAAIPMEKVFFLNWMVAQIRELQKGNSGDDAKVMAGIHELLLGVVDSAEDQATQTTVWDQVVKASGGTSDGVIRLIQEEELVYQKLAAIMGLAPQESENQIQRFNAEAQQSQNPLLSLTLPAIIKARTKEIAVEVKLAMVKAAVQYKLRGEAGAKSVMDPWTQKPFAFERFVFQGVDRGLQLKSSYAGRGFPEVLIFVEKEGPPFYTDGPHAGQALSK